MKRDAVIVSAVRTAIARQGGALATLPAHVYGAEVIKEAMRRANIGPELVADVIMGNVLSGGGNIARLTALQTGLSLELTGLTVDRQCGSGINAVNLAAQAIWAGDGDVYIAGGVESMSRAPYLMDRPEKPYSSTPPSFRKSQLSPKEIGDPPMGITAENLVKKYGISREEQDAFALRSQQRMARAMQEGRFDEQIVPITVPVKKGEPFVFDTDEHPRPNTTMEALAKLPPAFLEGGTVTAGNSSGLNDAAAALVVMSREKAEQLGLTPLAVVRAYAVAGVDPNIMGIGPVPATRKVLEKVGLTLDEMDIIEINEAFAAQVIACDRELEMNPEKVNVNGGAIAHGHPLGATGAILITKAVYELKRRGGTYALITACIGGGQGIATIIERA
ncbi:MULTISPECIES: thiolase family protein [Geobacillus]|jgi:acetyl-CoA C-acetyltransferase|uniref:acetyl-CoA C-acetyltransferase n=4 Tax=Geobacillus thermodenitrificans TaxID=33940 RepID=A4INH3_GEOTN|nr:MULTISPECIES: thiolase family protein [Geobacillus]ABO66877.1 Acetyl-CoA acetyltransferase [Geobacillus thermodenitrificans NG80-2]ARA96777.1 acetyl-CoA acetyltransferase [Geobacillus thermodenitrificans]ATO36049.1 acetyl-CoA acetyltransferase [Geobacillus thermodenitrificans]KQB93442.1 Acetyl-CoA acetyltransferase [Geobacillus sp. PA-3]MED0661683.1 acetyl-CoA C-acyltransferase [Geobacillus thermodenitrificans]